MPPLSAMNKYERSTKESDNRDYQTITQKRAGTNMEVRGSGPEVDQADPKGSIHESDAFVSIAAQHKKPKGADPFYSHDMVKLADEARDQLKTIDANKIEF